MTSRLLFPVLLVVLAAAVAPGVVVAQDGTPTDSPTPTPTDSPTPTPTDTAGSTFTDTATEAPGAGAPPGDETASGTDGNSDASNDGNSGVIGGFQLSDIISVVAVVAAFGFFILWFMSRKNMNELRANLDTAVGNLDKAYNVVQQSSSDGRRVEQRQRGTRSSGGLVEALIGSPKTSELIRLSNKVRKEVQQPMNSSGSSATLTNAQSTGGTSTSPGTNAGAERLRKLRQDAEITNDEVEQLLKHLENAVRDQSNEHGAINSIETCSRRLAEYDRISNWFEELREQRPGDFGSATPKEVRSFGATASDLEGRFSRINSVRSEGFRDAVSALNAVAFEYVGARETTEELTDLTERLRQVLSEEDLDLEAGDPEDVLLALLNQFQDGRIGRRTAVLAADRLDKSPVSPMAQNLLESLSDPEQEKIEIMMDLEEAVDELEEYYTTQRRLAQGRTPDELRERLTELAEECRGLESLASDIIGDQIDSERERITDEMDSTRRYALTEIQKTLDDIVGMLSETDDPPVENIEVRRREVAEEIQTFKDTYIKGRQQYGNLIPTHFANAAEGLLEEARKAHQRGEDETAEGFIRAAEDLLEALNGMYEDRKIMRALKKTN